MTVSHGEGVRVEPTGVEAVPEMVRLHTALFPGHPSTILGAGHLVDHYRTALLWPGGAGFVARAGDAVVGYVCGTGPVNPLRTGGFPRRALARLAARIVSSPAAARALLDWTLYAWGARGLEVGAELVGLGVDPDWRRRGIAWVLVEALIGHYRAAGVARFHVFSHEGDGGPELYEAMGFRTLRVIPLSRYAVRALIREVE